MGRNGKFVSRVHLWGYRLTIHLKPKEGALMEAYSSQEYNNPNLLILKRNQAINRSLSQLQDLNCNKACLHPRVVEWSSEKKIFRLTLARN